MNLTILGTSWPTIFIVFGLRARFGVFAKIVAATAISKIGSGAFFCVKNANFRAPEVPPGSIPDPPDPPEWCFYYSKTTILDFSPFSLLFGPGRPKKRVKSKSPGPKWRFWAPRRKFAPPGESRKQNLFSATTAPGKI